MTSSPGYRSGMLPFHESPTPERYRQMLEGFLEITSDQKRVFFNMRDPFEVTTYRKVLLSATVQNFCRSVLFWLCSRPTLPGYELGQLLALPASESFHPLSFFPNAEGGIGTQNGGIERVILYDRHDTLGACTRKPASGKLSCLSAIDWLVFRCVFVRLGVRDWKPIFQRET
jgi:hypothetical protein